MSTSLVDEDIVGVIIELLLLLPLVFFGPPNIFLGKVRMFFKEFLREDFLSFGFGWELLFWGDELFVIKVLIRYL